MWALSAYTKKRGVTQKWAYNQKVSNDMGMQTRNWARWGIALLLISMSG